MQEIDINRFMTEFHAIERDMGLFDDLVNGEPWWDTVRYNVCCYIFECMIGSSYSAANRLERRPNPLGALRRNGLRHLLYAKALVGRSDVLALRAPRTTVHGRYRDTILDPLVGLIPRTLTVDTLPRRFHLPDYVQARWPGTAPEYLPEIARALLSAFGIDGSNSDRLEAIIRRSRGEFACQVSGYHRLFDLATPRLVMLVQNGIEKALFNVARTRGVPVVEAQHGAVGFGHPQYSYARGRDYDRVAFMPDLFLTFSDFWQRHVYYPARRQASIGSGAMRPEVAQPGASLGKVMVCSANIYHRALAAVTRDAAALLSDRTFIYKLHPNQSIDERAITAEFADLPNVIVGAPGIPALEMLDGVSHLVAIQSTVVYEALQGGRRVCIVPGLDYALHADVFDQPGVDVTPTLNDLVVALDMLPPAAPYPVFFDPFDSAAARELLAPLVGQN